MIRIFRLPSTVPLRSLCDCWFLCVLALLGGGLASGCATNSSSDAVAESPDTVVTSAAAEVEPAPRPSAPTELEKQSDNRSIQQKLDDARLEARVKQALVNTSILRVFSFQPTVINSHLILRGDVNTANQYGRAERVGRQVDGIEAVTNRLTMGGQPVTEERLNADAAHTGDDDAVYHTVRPGDTVWDIARQYQSSAQQIRSLNNIRTVNLRPGQKIRVR